MIYSAVDVAAPIQQGDIFLTVPRFDADFSNLNCPVEVNGETDFERRDYTTKPLDAGSVFDAIIAFRAVPAVVITPDCDCLRGESISLCEIVSLGAIDSSFDSVKGTEKWVKLFLRTMKQNPKWFYFPPDARFKLNSKMAADFRLTIRHTIANLETLKQHSRVGRLSDLAREDFRNRLAAYMGGYPSDEWYPLNADEFAAYNADHGGKIQPFAWQKKA